MGITELKIQNILFPRQNICTQKELYFRANDEDTFYSEKQNCLHIKNTVTFDTYFNTFACGKYNEYCRPLSLYLRLSLSGVFVVRVFGVQKEDNHHIEKCIAEQNIITMSQSEVVLSLAHTESYSHLYFTLEGTGTLYNGGFSAELPNCNSVNIAVVICTFKREQFLLRNHHEICRYLRKSEDFTPKNIHVYIVDNGQTLDKQQIENDYISLIPNENTGGSGGFTCGYYEALHSGNDYTHVLFMDDDIVLDCEMLFRVYRLLQFSQTENLAVGGTMLKLSDRITQHEAGAYWDGKRLHSLGNGNDMTQRENVFAVSDYPQCNYNAWWFYCFPANWQKQYGYPLQFFVKEDDIEYSLRCADKIAIVNGIAVWHDDFEGKYDGFQEYYIKRNELIMTSVNHQKPYALFQVRKLVFNVMQQIVFQRYFLADIVLRAYGDYLLGWEHFKNTDTAALNQELMASCKKLLNDETLEKEYGVAFDQEKYDRSMTEPHRKAALIFTLNGHLLPSYRESFNVVDLAKCQYTNFYRHRKVLHYDVKNHRGFVTEQKRGKMFRYLFRLVGMSVRFLIRYPSVRKGYKKHLPELADYRLKKS